MKVDKLTLAQRFRSFDPFLLLCTSGLSLISLLTLWGGRDSFGTRAFFMQLAMNVVGIAFMILVASFDYELLDLATLEIESLLGP